MGKLVDGQGGASKAVEQCWGCWSGVWVSSVEESCGARAAPGAGGWFGEGRGACVCVGPTSVEVQEPGGTFLCSATWAVAALLARRSPKSAAYIHNGCARRPPELEGISQRAHF